MDILHVKGFGFSSYIKLMLLISVSSGLIFGIILFTLSLFGFNVYVNFGSTHIRGVSAGIISIFLSPMMFTFLGIIFSLFSFLPFKYALKFTKGIKINLNYAQSDVES
ncbi:hypothetical protein GCM10008967_27730 [Bacillus carboniphilus]|uniref:ABC3 transporter permease protein domain-containing protein n=1 Tax=Bacillus carboniphilus TaxID=86663 RepID=A0ABN0WFS6_9BACI